MGKERDLQTCGPSWFIVYAYYKYINRNEIRWKNIGTVDTRVDAFERIVKEVDFRSVVKDILEHKTLKSNKFGVPVVDVEEMAKKIMGKK